MTLAVKVVLIGIFSFVVWRWLKLWLYWKVRGIKSYGYPPPIGCLLPVWTERLSIPQLTKQILDSYPNQPFVGTWVLSKPILIIKDSKIVHQILSEDCSVWTDRGFKDDPKLDPLSQHLINITGPKWKLVRLWLTSSFSTIGLKNKLGILTAETERMISAMSSKERVDIVRSSKQAILSILSRISIGVPESPPEVERMVHQAFVGSFWTTLRSAFRLSCPVILSSINCKRFQSDHERAFFDFVDGRIRSKNNHEDLLQILIDSYQQYKTQNPLSG